MSAQSTVADDATLAEPGRVGAGGASDGDAETALAARLDGEVVRWVARDRRSHVELSRLLAALVEGRRFRRLGYPSIFAYAQARGLPLSSGQARELASLGDALRGLPLLRAAFESGDVSWTKARTAARAATAADESGWLEAARSLSSRALERRVAEARGEAPTTRKTLVMTEEQAAWLERALLDVRARVDRRLTDAQALELLCRTVLRADVPRCDAPPRPSADGEARVTEAPPRPAAARVVLHHCPACARTTVETRTGPVEVSPATLERVRCDAEVHDRVAGSGRVTRTVPPRIVNEVTARDRGRCRVPGCDAVGFLHIHHEPGRASTGHDPRAMLLLCEGHHGLRHEGLLAITRLPGDGHPEFRFETTTGEVLGGPTRSSGEAGASRDAVERGGPDGAGPTRPPQDADSPPRAVAPSPPGASGSSESSVASSANVDATAAEQVLRRRAFERAEAHRLLALATAALPWFVGYGGQDAA